MGIQMKNRVLNFLRNDDGAVTVDWVVISAGIVAMAVAVFLSMETGTLELTGDVSTFLDAQGPN